MVNKTILFSGRFDRPHISHIDTITKLGQEYKKVLVVVLDYPEQCYPVQYRAQRLGEVLGRCKGNYEVVINKVHFGKITASELGYFDFDVYGTGNMEVLKHIESLNVKCRFIDKSDDTAASDEARFQKIKEIMK